MLKKIILCLFVSIFVCGCCKTEKAPSWAAYTNLRMTAKKSVFIQDSNIKNPGALLATEHFLYVISKEENCVLCYDYDGKLINSFGKMGNGKGEFDTPTAIACDEQYIYVADENSGRIQCFDFDGNYQKEVYVDELNDISVHVFDIESDGKNLYVSAGSTDKQRIGIYRINSENKIKRISKSGIGCFGKNTETNEIYFANAYEYFEKDDRLGYQGGNSYLGKISNGKLKKLFLLPEQYLPAELHIEDGEILILSEALMEVDAFDYSGNYMETLFAEVAENENRGVSNMAVREGVIFLSDTENNLVYRIGVDE